MVSIRNIVWTAVAVIVSAGLLAPAYAQDFPEGFIAPPIHPEGAELKTVELGPGVYALMSTKPPVDNSGFVVGERGVLVIDAHINKEMAEKIQAAVRKVTDKPILYLVNTNYHGDHTFGNYAFPAETRIVAHRETAKRMKDFEHEKKFMMVTVDNDPAVFGDVQLRLPDIIFDDHVTFDLGGRFVEVYHFGPGNTPGDTVVYVPEAKAAWTGNLVVGEGTIPLLLEGGAGDYIGTIGRLSGALDLETIVPGHALLTNGEILGRYMRYLNDLIQSVRKSIGEGRTLEQTLSTLLLPADYRPAPGSPMAALEPFLAGVHLLNVQQTYKELNGEP